MARNRVVRRSGGSFRRSPGRLTEWFSNPYAVDATTLAANTFIVVTSLTAAGLAKIPFTITRTVGIFSVMSDQAGAIEHPLLVVGGMVVSAKAVTTGATAIPDPVTEVNSDEWFLHQALSGPTATALTNNGVEQFHFDSRAQRKVQDGEDIVFVIANPNTVDGARFWFQFRMLVKLS